MNPLHSLKFPSTAARNLFLVPRKQRTLATISNMTIPMKAEITAEVGGQANVERLRSIARDFRSDTLTIPTDAMLLAGLQASRGDDVYHEDQTTAELEARVARLAGKEAGLFLVSGTMSNQLAIRTNLTQPPHSVLLDHRAHVHKMEAGGIAVFSQATSHSVVPANGHHLTLEDDIRPNLELGEDIHTAPTRLISLENTLSGMIFPQEEIEKIAKVARESNIIMHLDGARIWEAAAARLGEDAGRGDEALQPVLTDLCAPFKSVSLCLSKGIGAPIGSVLVGPQEFITRARWFRKMFGGGIRQSGAIAAAASTALTHNFPKLHRTHVLARRLADGLVAQGAQLLQPTETNMVWINLAASHLPTAEFIAAAQEKGITVRGARVVVHHQIEESAIEDLLEVVREVGTRNRKIKESELPRINEGRVQERTIIGAGYQ